MNQKVRSSLDNLLPNLKRLKATKAKIYEQRICLYKELMEGGNGGILPDGSEFRSLHFPDWTSADFAQLLFELDEIEEIPFELEIIDEIDEIFSINSEEENGVSSVEVKADVRKGWFGKLFGR